MRRHGKYSLEETISPRIPGLKFLVVLSRKHFITRIGEEGPEDQQHPFEFVYQGDAKSYENDAENDRHQDTNQQYPAEMFFLYTEGRKDNDEHKNIINTKAPLHEIGAEIL